MERDVKGTFKAPVLGVAYYPEAWSEEEQEYDVLKMKEAGITCVRMGEFAWHNMEPKEGEFDFSWLHRITDKLWAAGISVILCTPSATPPLWLEEKDPSMLRMNEGGLRELHGGRRHCCSNNDTYRKYSVRIAEELGREFGKKECVAGWQIDNEIFIQERGCFCETCQKQFHQFLKEKYKTIENLNQRWNLNLWSQWYENFEQIPMPARSFQSLHLLSDWKMFQSASHTDFIKIQADVLRKYTNAPIGTAMMTNINIDYEKIAEFTDVIQHTHYQSVEYLYDAVMWFDYLRTLKNRPFWNLETSPCWKGRTDAYASIPPEGFCRANSWLPIVLGGESNFYWLWRQHRAGHELLHGSILYASGRPMHIFKEVQEVAEGYAKCSEFFEKTKVVTEVAMMLSTHNQFLMGYQKLANKGDYLNRFAKMHRFISEYGIRPDVIGVNHSLENYKVLFTPYMLTLEIGDVGKRIREWVERGGIWIVGPMADIRDDIGAHYTDRETGMIETMSGAVLTDQVPDYHHSIQCSWTDGTEFLASDWLQLFDIPDGARSFVTVTGDYYSTLSGKSLVFEKHVGKGKMIVLGATPDEEGMHRLLDILSQEMSKQDVRVTGAVAISHRIGTGISGYAVVNYGDKAESIAIDGEYCEIITGNTIHKAYEIKPYQIAVFEKN